LDASREGLLANQRGEQLVRRPALRLGRLEEFGCELAHPAQPQPPQPGLELGIELEAHARRR